VLAPLSRVVPVPEWVSDLPAALWLMTPLMVKSPVPVCVMSKLSDRRIGAEIAGDPEFLMLIAAEPNNTFIRN